MSRQIILDICKQEGINVKVLSRDWLFRLEKNGKVRYIFSNCLPLNSQSSGLIASDKFATFEVLNAAGIPIIEHAILYPFDNHRDFAEGCNTPEYLENYFNKHQQNIVLKPNRGFGGRGITHITSVRQFPQALEDAFAHAESASLCPFYHVRREYRVIMLDGEPRLIYGKERSNDWRFNLQNGANSAEITDSVLRNRLVSIAKRTVAELKLRFCSVDIVELDPTDPHLASPGAHELLVIEVNSAVATACYLEQHPDQFELVEDIYRDAVLKMFE